MATNDNSGEDGNSTRSVENPSNVYDGGATCDDERLGNVDAGHEGCGASSKGAQSQPTNGDNLGRSEFSNPQRKPKRGENGVVTNVAHVWKGRGRAATEAEGCRGACNRSESLLLAREDCKDKGSVHSVYADASGGISGGLEGTCATSNKKPVSVPGSERRTDKDRASTRQPTAGAAVPTTRCASDLGSNQHFGREAAALQRPHQRDNATKVPGLWEGLRGGSDPVESSGGASFIAPNQPSFAEVSYAFGGSLRVSKRGKPLHLKKHVKPMDVKKLLCLENKTPECREYVVRALRWLYDPEMYGEQGALQPKRARFTKDQFDEMLGYKYKPLVGLPEGFVEGFLRLEPSKNEKCPYRLRPLFAPDANEVGATKDKLQRMRMSLKNEIRDNGSDNPEFVIQFDMESYYDQFELAAPIKRKMCLCGDDGVIYALERLPMGLRPACEVAQSVTWFLLDFEMDARVKVNTCIDNVRFVGPKNVTMEAVRTFLKRCSIVGAQLDKTPDGTEAALLTMSERKGDFLGEHYDYDAGTRCLTKKTTDKLAVIGLWLDGIQDDTVTLSARQLSILMGMVFWTRIVLGFQLAEYFHLLRDYRRVAAMAADSGYDEATITMTVTALKELREWFRMASLNNPVTMQTHVSGKPSMTIITDASGVGFGAIATSDFSACQILNGAWSPDQLLKARSSVWAEPEAIYLACCRFVRPQDRYVRIYTDHSPVVYAAKAGYAKGFSPNHLLQRLNKTFPNTLFEVCHVKGINNPADRMSRLGAEMGAASMELDAEEKGKVAMLAAEGWERGVKDNVCAHNGKPSFMV